jgi:dipeptidyl aminopeptidase/acylaminoacyl peptidase
MTPLATLLPLSLLAPPGNVLPAGAQPPHPFSVADLITLKRVLEYDVSPDGRLVAFILRSTDYEANRGRTDLYLVGSDGLGLRQMTNSDASESSIRWSRDGRSLYFLSDRTETSQVWRIDVGGGEAVQVSDFPMDVQELVLSPDGRGMLVFFEVYPSCGNLECTTRRDEERARSKASGRIYDQLFVRHWDTWKDGKRRHPFAWIPGQEPKDLMAGIDADCPSKPFGGTEEIAFTPDGRELVYTARVAGREEAWSTNFDLFRVPFDGSRVATCLTCENKAWDTGPVFSSDGRTLAWLAMSRPGFEADQKKIQLMDMATGKVRTLAPDWDRSVDMISFDAGNRRLLATGANQGQVSVFAIDVPGGKVTTLVRDGSNDLPRAAGKRLVFARDTLTAPKDLFSMKPDGTDIRPVTAVNAEALASIRFGQPERFSFTGAHGDTVEGWVVRPVEFDPARKYPVAFLVHGGPQGSWDNHFHYRWNPQIYAAAGYVAVMVDFHGSTGYGQAFQDAIRNDWGGAPFEDLMKGLDAVGQKYPFADIGRTCALGASYGGFMINWIAGQTDRFKCLVTHDGNLDERMAYFDTEELWFPEWEHGGTPWENPEGYVKHNPIDHVGKWRTPMLVVHSAKDYRVVDTQGLSTFTALQRRGIPSKLLFFPDENHWVLKPQNSELWHHTVLDWLATWLKAE